MLLSFSFEPDLSHTSILYCGHTLQLNIERYIVCSTNS